MVLIMTGCEECIVSSRVPDTGILATTGKMSLDEYQPGEESAGGNEDGWDTGCAV
jgi:hypothetical protein